MKRSETALSLTKILEGFSFYKKLITFNHYPDYLSVVRKEIYTMELTPEMIEQLKADLKTAKTYQDLMGDNGAIKKIIKATLEGMLDAVRRGGLQNTWVTRNTHLLVKTLVTVVTAEPIRH